MALLIHAYDQINRYYSAARSLLDLMHVNNIPDFVMQPTKVQSFDMLELISLASLFMIRENTCEHENFIVVILDYSCSQNISFAHICCTCLI